MNVFERELPSYRLAQTAHGDTLQTVAAREMGDANRWPELAWINELVYPYLTDDESQVTRGVVLNGTLIKVPAPAGVYTDDAESGQVYERDCELKNKRLLDDGKGDFSVVSGTKNLSQQLKHRVVTPRGQARRHPEYGCMVWLLQGTVNGPTANALAAQYVKAALKADYRVANVTSSKAEMVGDAIRITASAEAIAGGKVDITNK